VAAVFCRLRVPATDVVRSMCCHRDNRQHLACCQYASFIANEWRLAVPRCPGTSQQCELSQSRCRSATWYYCTAVSC
jgi:hypothetical protein